MPGYWTMPFGGLQLAEDDVINCLCQPKATWGEQHSFCLRSIIRKMEANVNTVKSSCVANMCGFHETDQ